ncbi:hypothetical protein LUU34_00191700 [Aix galericulata]|nr:hypothetical protein LUU34_00191700 [Aix galericulata]
MRISPTKQEHTRWQWYGFCNEENEARWLRSYRKTYYRDSNDKADFLTTQRREQQWAQNIIPHWREWSGKEVLHPWQQLCDFKWKW